MIFQRLSLGESQNFWVLEVFLNMIRPILYFLFLHLNRLLTSLIVLYLILDRLHLLEPPHTLINRIHDLLRLHHRLILHPCKVLLPLHVLLLLLVALLETVKALLDFLPVSLGGLETVSVLGGVQLLTLVLVLLGDRLLEFRK